jgi:eukaryotic-like serine/threonine-protein kinase
MALQRPSDEIAPGAIVGNTYRVDHLLGEGGMGQVFAVTHLKLNKKFALKLLKKEMARDPETRARFLNEAQASGQIHHPNVVEVTDFASLSDGTAYMVMEYLDGQPLSRMIKLGGAIPAQRAVSIIRDIASGLGAAHEAGVVHRDLKPDNVFVLQSGGREIAKILDFGVAKVAGAAKLTRTGIVFGTPHYMSPEQASGGAIGAGTDIYALGVIMYEMFTGRVPFEADTYMGVLTKHMFEAPLPPSQLTGVARELGALEDITLRALAKRPEDRYASMSELVADLDRVVSPVGNGEIRIAPGTPRRVYDTKRPTLSAGSTSLADELEPPAREEVRIPAHRAREKRVRAVGFFVVSGIVVVAAVVGGVALARGRKSNDDASSTTRPPESATAEAAASDSPSVSASARSASRAAVSASASSEPSASPSSTASTTTSPSVAPTYIAPAGPVVHVPTRKPVGSDIDDPWKH